jgi:ABC-type protease/lipase transport system fused ATPase/permease subunit
MIVNNWFITAEMFVNISNNSWVRLYFVAFYLLAVLVGMNIIVCFAIDMYSSIKRLDSEQRVHEDKLFALALEVKKKKQREEGENRHEEIEEEGVLVDSDEFTILVKRKDTTEAAN